MPGGVGGERSDYLTAPIPIEIRSNLSNPKVAIFYFAFLPQFVPHGSSHTAVMLPILGTAFAVLTFLVKGPVGYGAGRLSGWMRARPAIQMWINRSGGTVLLALGVKLVFERNA